MTDDSYQASYLAGTNARQQSGFALSEADWERYRKPIVEPIHRGGSFLDVGCNRDRERIGDENGRK